MKGPETEYQGPNATTILNQLASTYTQCLVISRDYTDRRLKNEIEKDEVNLDALANFLEVRAELFRSAEDSLQHLAGQERDEDDFMRNKLTDKAVSILEEMAEIEARLTDYLSGQLEKMKTTIGQMRKSEPVFKRYSNLGGHIHPSRITRHE